MIFQQYVRQCCGSSAAEAHRRLAAHGTALSYQQVFRYLNRPRPMPIAVARVVVEATEGQCSLDELIDANLILASFDFEASDSVEARAIERKALTARIEQREREVGQLEAAARLGPLADLQRDLRALRLRLDQLDAELRAPRKRGRPTKGNAPRKRARRARPASAAA